LTLTENETGGRRADSAVDAQVLGQLLHAMPVLEMLPTAERMAELLSAALAEIPGVKSCAVRLGEAAAQGEVASGPGRWAVPVETGGEVFGDFVLEVDDEPALRPYLPFVVNLAGQVALLTENQLRRDRLEVALAETRISEAENARLAAIVNSSDDAILTKTLEGTILTWNAGAERMYGYAAEEIIGESVSRLIPPDSEEQLETLLDHVRRGEPVQHYEAVRVRKDGTRIDVSLGLSPLRDAAGVLVGASSIARDVTERRAAAEALREGEERYRSLFEGLTEGVALHELVLDEQGSPLDYRILAVNPAFTAQTGMSAEAVCGKLASEAYGGGQAPFLERYAGATLSGEPARFQEHFAPLGRDFDITAVRQSEGHFATLFEDVTERKAAEADLLRRTAQLEAANKELEAFVYSAAHDLRAPLRAIDGFSQMVVEDAADKLSAEDHEHLQRVRSAAQRMARLIDQLLGLARAARNELHVEELDVSALATAVLAELAEADPGRRIETVVAPNLRAAADATLLGAVLANLLDNAWKFTSKHETARIEVGVTDVGGEQAFFVRDDGAGFDPQYAAHLFGAFQRMHAEGLFEGDGIGLATVQRLVAKHGGRVWAEAEVEKGATFCFTLPEKSAPSA